MPYGVSVSPSAGSGAAAVFQNLQFAWASPAGQPLLESGSILIQDSAFSTPNLTNGCYLLVIPTGAVQLADDAGVTFSANAFTGATWSISPSNAHCALNGPASAPVTVSSGGASQQVTLNMSFNSAWAGKTLRIWLKARNTNYASGVWQQFGIFTVTPYCEWNFET